MSEKDNKKLLHRISVLENQNAKLKKQLSQYKKYVNRSADIILNNYEIYQEIEVTEKSEKVKKCDECGKGDVKKLKILNFNFEICPICQYRKKIK
jgi:formylmethanofuran dehydrogenase subunit E